MKSAPENGFNSASTSSSLLRQVRNTNDQLAWERFVRFYSPLLRQTCRGLKLDPETADEVSQRVWVELSSVMPTFAYSPGFRFRLWLKKFCWFRAVDFIRERDRERLLSIEATREVESVRAQPDDPPDESEVDPRKEELARKALAICETVRGCVKENQWQAFCHVTVDGWSARETANALQMTYAAVFMARKRVENKLREEAERYFNNV